MLGLEKNKIYPLPLAPQVTEKSWGEIKPSTYFEEGIKKNVKWGELWLAINEYGLASEVASGPFKGLSLDRLSSKWSENYAKDGQSRERILPFSLRIERTGSTPGPIRISSEPEFWWILEATPESWLSLGQAEANDPRTGMARQATEPDQILIMPPNRLITQGPKLTVLKVLPFGSTITEKIPKPGSLNEIPKNNPTDGPLILKPHPLDENLSALTQNQEFRIDLLTTSSMTYQGNRLTLLCPLNGQGRILASGPVPATRLSPGVAVMIPAGMGLYTIESNTLLKSLIFSLEP